ncbi:hypothetical protein [Burkholderia pseudomultivorans]|uniref:hypothetical protein n=1 Tax=Burkholderia pseudomultivorans TaxID=1207504 RepID=UPI0012D88349|nr:hypothetical protein [Burkholderia pseudomultivorans]
MTTKFPLALIIAVTSAAISASAAITAATIQRASAGMIPPTSPMAKPTLQTGPSIPVVDTTDIARSIGSPLLGRSLRS